MNDFMKGIIFLAIVFYVVSPIDLAPGPIDDLIVVAIGFAKMKSLSVREE